MFKIYSIWQVRVSGRTSPLHFSFFSSEMCKIFYKISFLFQMFGRILLLEAKGKISAKEPWKYKSE